MAKQSNSSRKAVKKISSYILLVLITLFMIGPFLWLLSTALKSGSENIFQYPPKLLPEEPTLANFGKVLDVFPFWRYLLNSVIVAVLTVILNVLFCSLAAYPLARMNFKGKNIIFILIIATMMIPFQLLMIPVYVISLKLGLQNTYLGMVLPHVTTAFGVFLMRQAFMTVPNSLDESARMDGANSFQIWYRILIPLVKPSIVTLTIFTFVSAWGDFLWPLIIVNDQNMFTLPLGLNMLSGTFTSDWRLIAAGAIISMIPIITIFLLLQRFFISGAMKGAVKG
ncbi:MULTISPECIES: carbohydrate ABC transporter permease [Ornithinibacillus]|uniref:Carbohydrate ABC transporter permease n=2 Tax=Ornithinibacillus TaxID=484508 RepID=A0A923RJ19_9BACI|nr:MULTISPECIES: carbohydrate ABC transporter permease [Ornithinibacillus]MBC5637654.1 carbohydrate ABC transporter permease [Ornithinibacillus hominis]MBS3681670.1 carbohydrate ABC transporter permease [Ornithinibacillus massiliensis]